MKQVEFWRWRYVDLESGAPGVTSYHIDTEDAVRRFPGAQPIEGTRESRDLPESPAEWQTAGRPKP